MVLLALVAVGTAAGRGGAEEAKASTQGQAGRTSRSTPNSDPFLGPLSFASKSRDPIFVNSDALEFDYQTRVLTYKGNVIATQADMKLQSHTLTITLDEQNDNRIKEVVADGAVYLTKGERWATGGHAVFNQASHTAVLTKDPVLHDGANQLSGEKVTVYLDEERFVVDGGDQRVKAMLYPPKEGETPGEASATPAALAGEKR